MKSAFKILLKFLFATAIIYWLVYQGKLDYQLVLLAFKNHFVWIACLVLFIFQVLIGALRWRIILQTRIKNIRLTDLFLVQWIGQFFSSISPGVAMGDLVKIGYIKSTNEEVSKKFLLFTILFDRLAGLFGLLLIAGLSSIIFYRDFIFHYPVLRNILFINIGLLLCTLFVFVLFFLNIKIKEKIKGFISFNKLNSLLDAIWSVNFNKKEIIQILLISIVSHFISIICFWIINLPFFEKEIKFEYLLSLYPLGKVAAALPISPSGLGVGHAAYDQLFQYIGHSNGASLFNVYWVVLFLANLFGAIPFVFYKKK